ncbi:MAG: hypothetical protein GY803_09910 [Chloroflexi bacterium]|nr:hypothetical protein [Chloroflexota bacterium]
MNDFNKSENGRVHIRTAFQKALQTQSDALPHVLLPQFLVYNDFTQGDGE